MKKRDKGRERDQQTERLRQTETDRNAYNLSDIESQRYHTETETLIGDIDTNRQTEKLLKHRDRDVRQLYRYKQKGKETKDGEPDDRRIQ